jgi:hypothetical protein
MRWALALLALLSGCDKLRAIPGVQPRSALPAPAPPAVAMGPWVLDPEPTQATICWVTDEPSMGRVWYGQAATDRLAREEGASVTEHRVTVHGLSPAKQYRYSIEGGAAGVFTSAPEPGAQGPIEVLVYGDNRTNSGDHALVVRAAAAERVQLALHTGDMVVNAREPLLWRDWFREEADLLSRLPFIATIGNHEMTDDGVAYSKYFQHRDRPPYWSVDYGPLHVVVMDSFERAPGPVRIPLASRRRSGRGSRRTCARSRPTGTSGRSCTRVPSRTRRIRGPATAAASRSRLRWRRRARSIPSRRSSPATSITTSAARSTASSISCSAAAARRWTIPTRAFRACR